VLGDMDLLCHEGEQSHTTCAVWEKMALHDPAGTIEMRPPEVKYSTCDICFKLFYYKY